MEATNLLENLPQCAVKSQNAAAERRFFFHDSATNREYFGTDLCPYCRMRAGFLYRRGAEVVGCERCVTLLEGYLLPEGGEAFG